eukprot:gnl/TRDRNA2_/TRDRNA2_168737_c1_seq2.p1 gnl/TRDRNA2_/TRDRNA2_168737_c1~~gnl/TRDRNA2_/TRDRNA2_168737_c1_seq2.p1  ORF type:complete len:450 (-),score=117.43 gnl/TRDRNA2_/TRDRNA2_168737_c1_seq2:332-1681(-)
MVSPASKIVELEKKVQLQEENINELEVAIKAKATEAKAAEESLDKFKILCLKDMCRQENKVFELTRKLEEKESQIRAKDVDVKDRVARVLSSAVSDQEKIKRMSDELLTHTNRIVELEELLKLREHRITDLAAEVDASKSEARLHASSVYDQEKIKRLSDELLANAKCIVELEELVQTKEHRIIDLTDELDVSKSQAKHAEDLVTESIAAIAVNDEQALRIKELEDLLKVQKTDFDQELQGLEMAMRDISDQRLRVEELEGLLRQQKDVFSEELRSLELAMQEQEAKLLELTRALHTSKSEGAADKILIMALEDEVSTHKSRVEALEETSQLQRQELFGLTTTVEELTHALEKSEASLGLAMQQAECMKVHALAPEHPTPQDADATKKHQAETQESNHSARPQHPLPGSRHFMKNTETSNARSRSSTTLKGSSTANGTRPCPTYRCGGA